MSGSRTYLDFLEDMAAALEAALAFMRDQGIGYSWFTTCADEGQLLTRK